MFKVNRENRFDDRKFIVAGGYVASIRAIKAEGSKLSVRFDIVEGELTNVFKNEYDANPSNEWNRKGIGEWDLSREYAERYLNAFIDCVEKSNNGYHWNGDEQQLKNKKVGVVYRKHTYRGSDGEMKQGTSFPEFVTVNDIKTNNYSIEEKGKKQSQQTEVKEESTNFNISEDDIQF